jgi:hypothetical protein
VHLVNKRALLDVGGCNCCEHRLPTRVATGAYRHCSFKTIPIAGGARISILHLWGMCSEPIGVPTGKLKRAKGLSGSVSIGT